MTQKAKALDAKTDNLSLIPGTHMVQELTSLMGNMCTMVSRHRHRHTVTQTHKHTVLGFLLL